MIEIRSYRRVFDLERRVYSVDRLRLNPGGVPVRGIVYLLAILAMLFALARLPLLGTLVRLLPWYLRDVALPGAAATVLSVIRIEGRTFHLAAHALLRHRIGPRRLVGVDRRAPSRRGPGAWEIVQLPDGSDSRMRRVRYTGPGAVLVALEHERSGRAGEHGRTRFNTGAIRPRVVVGERGDAGPLERAEVIVLHSGVRLFVRPGAAARG